MINYAENIEHLQNDLEFIICKYKKFGLTFKQIKKEYQSKIRELNMRIDIEKELKEA